MVYNIALTIKHVQHAVPPTHILGTWQTNTSSPSHAWCDWHCVCFPPGMDHSCLKLSATAAARGISITADLTTGNRTWTVTDRQENDVEKDGRRRKTWQTLWADGRRVGRTILWHACAGQKTTVDSGMMAAWHAFHASLNMFWWLIVSMSYMFFLHVVALKHCANNARQAAYWRRWHGSALFAFSPTAGLLFLCGNVTLLHDTAGGRQARAPFFPSVSSLSRCAHGCYHYRRAAHHIMPQYHSVG